MPRTPSSQRIGLVTIEKRKDGNWRARYTTPAGRRQESLKVKTVEAAQVRAQEINLLLERGEYATLLSRSKLKQAKFSELVAVFERDYTGWSPATLRGMEGCRKKCVEEWGNLPAVAVSTQMIQGYLSRRLDAEEITPATANRYLSFLRRLYKCAVRWGYMGFSPAEGVQFLKEQVEPPDALTDEQLDKILRLLPDRARALAIVAVDTGMRYGEMRRLIWSDVDMARRLITIRKTGLQETKNKDFRVIPMTERVFRHFVQWRELEDRLTAIPMQDIKRSLSAAGHKAGVGHVHFHQFRHTFITRLFDRGVPFNDVMNLAGHKTPSMTQRYDHARPERHRGAIAALEES